MKHNKIRTKFLVLIIAMFIPVLIFQLFSISNDRKSIIQNKLESDLYLSEAISNSFDIYIKNIWAQEDIVSTYLLNNPALTTEEISSYLKQIVDKHETIENLFWLNSEGEVIASSSSIMIGRDLSKREYVQRVIEGEEEILSDLVNSYHGNNPVLPIAKAVKEKGILAGIMVASIDIENIGSLFSGLRFDESDIFTLIDKSGTIIYQDGYPDIYRNRIKIDPDSPIWGALGGEIIKTERKFSQNHGLYILGCSYPIGKTGWAVSLNSKYDEVIKNVHKKTNETIILFEIMIIVFFLIAFLIGDYFVTPIIKLKDAAYSIMNGDYSVRTNITGNDEIAITAQTFDIMAESIERHDKQKSQFFINLSHELKTPLNVILASLQLIDKIHITSETCHNYRKIHEQLSLMRQNCYRLIRMVSNLIDLSRHDNGFLKLKLGNYNIVNVIEDITMSIVRYAETKKIEILFDTDIEEKYMAFDPDAIERIMLNLFSNALKFTEEGGSIFVSLLDKGDKISVSIKDTGIGIPQDSLSSIFERFCQVDSTLNRNNEGSGIGLSLVKALVETHGGKIEVESSPNEGTKFTIELPAALLEEEEIVESDEIGKNRSRIVEKINLEFSDIYGFQNTYN